jgi:site-specific DNA recombinase
VPRPVKTVDRPKKDWTEIPVPAIVTAETFTRVQHRLADNKRFAARNTKVPSLLQGLAACSACGNAYYRGHTTTTAGNKIYYYRCLGSDNHRCQDGRVCGNKPVRADYLDTVVWDHITLLLADPALVRAEITKRLEAARTSGPVTSQRNRLEAALAKATTAITAMIEALSEQLITLDELRGRMPHLRARHSASALASPASRARRACSRNEACTTDTLLLCATVMSVNKCDRRVSCAASRSSSITRSFVACGSAASFRDRIWV